MTAYLKDEFAYNEMMLRHDCNEPRPMTISPEAKEAASKVFRRDNSIKHDKFSQEHFDAMASIIQLAINSAKAPLEKEIERLKSEVEKAYKEGAMIRWSAKGPRLYWQESRAKRVAEGKE